MYNTSQGLPSVTLHQSVAVMDHEHLLSDMHIMANRLGAERNGTDCAFAYAAVFKVGFWELIWSPAVSCGTELSRLNSAVTRQML